MEIKYTCNHGTPPSNWYKNNEVDPHGETYQGTAEKLACADKTCRHLADMIVIMGCVPLQSIVYTTGVKERMRWLSRCLIKEAIDQTDHDNLCRRRSELPMGELTDDELANYQYMDGDVDTPQGKLIREAAQARMYWLLEQLDARRINKAR